MFQDRLDERGIQSASCGIKDVCIGHAKCSVRTGGSETREEGERGASPESERRYRKVRRANCDLA